LRPVIPAGATVIPAGATVIPAGATVIPAKAGIQPNAKALCLDSRRLGNDDLLRPRHSGMTIPRYWQASQSGLSIEQNLAASPVPSPAPSAETAAIAERPPPEGTALSSPPLPVDFSAEVAASVRR